MIFALVDPMTYLIFKLGHGYHGHLSPWLEYPGTKFGWFWPKAGRAVKGNVRTHAHTDGRTYGALHYIPLPGLSASTGDKKAWWQ